MLLPRLQKKTIYLLLILSFFLSTCAPVPKEGAYKETVQVNLKLQHRSNFKSTRTGSETRISEFLVLAQADTPFRQSGPLPEELADPEAIYEVIGDEVKGVSVQLGKTYSVFIFRFGFPLNQDDFKSFWQYGDLEFSVNDYGKGLLEIPNELTEQGAALSLDIQLQREAIFIDSVVWGLSYQAGDRINDTNEDGLIFYFPGEEIKLWLANIPLGTFNPTSQFSTRPRILTPYSIFGEQEGTYSDRVINFVSLLLSVDWDQNPENGIRIDHDQVDQLPVKSLDDFSDNSLFTGLRISAEFAKRHLASSMRVKNFPESAFDVIVTVPGDQDDHAFVEGVIAVAFTENLRSRSINEGQILVSDSQGNAVEGNLRLDRNWLIFQPFSPLKAFQTYQVFLEPGIYSQSGKRLESGLTWSFTTEDHLDLQAYEFPEDNSTNVPIDTTISLNLDSPIFQGSQDVRWQLELDNGTQIPCQASFQLISVSCIPTVTLPTNDNLSVTLLQGSIQILNGIDIPDLSWKFSTGSSMSLVGPALDHLGEFNDNVTGSNVVLLRVGDGGPQYQLGQGEAPSARDELWAAPMYYPIQVPFFLDDAEGDQQVKVWYREEDGTLLDNRSINITLDQEPPAGLITILDDGHHSPFNYLVMANDNLSGAWRYLISDIPDYRPMPDSEEWISFPETPLDPSTRQELFNRSDLLQYPLNDLIALSSSVQNYDPTQDNDQGFASLDNFSQLLPVWDNGSFTLSDPNAEWITLYLQDQAGNIKGYSLGNPTEGNLDYEGDGSETNPYLVYDANELQAIGASTTSLSAHYQLANNIDLAVVTWTPIGTSTAPFSGSLNGYDSSNGTHYRISNLSINSSSQYQGLFGYTRNAEFNKVELDNVTIHSTSNHVGALIGYADNTSLQSNYAQIDNISGASYVGGLVGEIVNSVINSGGAFRNCNYTCDGEVSGSGDYVGGYAGKITNSQINNGYSDITVRANPSSTSAFIGGFVGAVLDSTLYNPGSDGEVIAIHSNQVGGLAGSVKNTSIDMSWSRSKVSGRNDVGGLVGKLDEYSEIRKSSYQHESVSGDNNTGGLVGFMVSTSQINYTYVIGDNDSNVIDNITGTSNVGGLVGSTQDNTTIFESFASIKVLGSSGVGGLIGFSAVNDNITTSYYDNETSSQNDTGKGFPRSKKQLEETQFAGGTVDGLQTFSNWNFDTIWQPRSNCRMPNFKQYLSFESECASFGENYFSGNSAPHHVSPYSNFQVGFNRPLNFLTIDNSSVYFSPYVKIAGYQYDNISQILKITPLGPLDNNTNYTLTLTNNIRSIDNLSPSQIDYSFTTNSVTLDLNQGLIAYYALDNNTFDYSGNGLDGIYVNGASPTPDRFNALDKAAALAGSQYISVPDNNFLDLTDNFSVAAWIYPTAVGSGEQGIVSKYHSSASPLVLELENDGSIGSDGLNSSKTLDNNTWYHVGLTRGNNTLKLFINGEKVTDNYTVISNSINTDNLTIGSDFNGRYFQGKIDEVKIYNRVLTDDEVRAMYAIADTLGPIVLNSSPTNGASTFPAGDNLSVDFSEPLLASSINSNSIELKRDADNSTISTNNLTFDPNTNKLLFEPSSLGSSQNYTLYLHSSIQDLAGNPLKATTISFQTSMLGSGTATDPYLINNANSLNKIRDNLTAHYKLTSDIDLSSISNWNPIGPSFEGSLNGDNKTIKNLRIDNSTGTGVGLFSEIRNTSGGAIVENIKFTNSFVRGLNDVGTVAGFLYNSSGIYPPNIIRNIIIDNATVKGNSNLGGLVGQAFGLIEQVGIKQLKLFITSNVTNANANAGGLVGDLFDGQIKESFAEGIIDNQSGNNKGGLIGMIRGSASLENSYAHVNVTGNIGVGSLIGVLQTSGTITKNSYSTGSANYPTSGSGGGAIGSDEFNYSNNDVSSVYYDNQTDTSHNDNVSATPATTAQLQQTQDNNTAIFSGWDFDNVWDPMTLCEYPRLRWENAPYGTCHFGETLSAGANYTCAVLDNGSAVCWGYNSNGQLGNGSSGSDNATPGNVLNLSNARSISAGLDQYGNYTCAVLDNGSARCWGKNHQGQLGNGSSGTDNATPGVVIGLESVKSISTGGYHACAVLDNGSARCWGDNSNGQLGNGSSGTDNATPGAVAGLQSVKFISAGVLHTCAVLDNGSARCWGDNSNGRLGNGSSGTDNATPGAVAGLQSVKFISAGLNHTCAVLDDGSARCWGSNSNGQLGDGTTSTSTSPVAVSGLGSVKTISAGKNYTCAVLENSSARCWGSNSNGQLGDGTTTTSTSPVAVSGLGSVNSISAGGTHTCALLNDKTAKCWGSNSNGELGNGSSGTDNATPGTVISLTNIRLP